MYVLYYNYVKNSISQKIESTTIHNVSSDIDKLKQRVCEMTGSHTVVWKLDDSDPDEAWVGYHNNNGFYHIIPITQV